MSNRGQLYEFPMRPGFLAQVILPRNVTALEVARLCAMLKTLPVPESVDTVPTPTGDATLLPNESPNRRAP